MTPIGSLLWRSLRIYQIFGSNTDVGKTILTTILCKATADATRNEQAAYLKPVSTGPSYEADKWHIDAFAPGVRNEILVQYDLAASPHLAARTSNRPVVPDTTILDKIRQAASDSAASGFSWLFIETAGGVHSPAPSGTTQADLYRPLRLPTVLVGDPSLGGISQTIAAFEALKMRGYDVEAIVLFQNELYKNDEYLADYFAKRHGIPVTALVAPPQLDANQTVDRKNMANYYEGRNRDTALRILEHLERRHQGRWTRLNSMADAAGKRIWYPFTQHKHFTADSITVIDSAYGNYFQALDLAQTEDVIKTQPSSSLISALQPSFDGSASWWTQGLGHGNAAQSLEAAYAAGRYGHVMFAEAVHEPALALAEKMVAGMKNPRLTRVFYSDNGSTGIEVAVKMALRAARVRYGWSASVGRKNGENDLEILGLQGSYHGDTMGAMACSEPSTYNEKVEWYDGKGVWLPSPTVNLVGGQWTVTVPPALEGVLVPERSIFNSLQELFDFGSRDESGLCRQYKQYMTDTLSALQAQGCKLGALLIEPVILGAGGMQFVDPLFQRTLVNIVRDSTALFGTADAVDENDNLAWTGLPVVFDEVFTGMYRLGRFSAASFLGVEADISVHAKLLTGGLVPLCTTLASESIFAAFLSDDKSDALLHGHSYTAHAIGCQVGLHSLESMQAMDAGEDWAWAKKNWTPHANSVDSVWSVWSPAFLDALSRNSAIEGVWALGSVLAIQVKSIDGSCGYKSDAARSIQAALRQGEGQGSARRWNVHSRVLGDVLYVMMSQMATEWEARRLEGLLRDVCG